ncbi:MAG: gliding motility-associated C-terminal domain-containing protein [Flavobacteriales bacterium]|nr:gliding motility-associated C-terminal domain-containing protein [Flavobacteriales bacterium]
MIPTRTLCLGGIILASSAVAQTSTSDCNGAIQLCGGVYTETTAPLGTGNVFEFTGTCNQSMESASIWYTFTVQEDGNLSFVLDPANDMDDYDWGLFDITNGGCAGINAQNGTSPEVQCNSYGSFITNGPTGISSQLGGSGNTNGPGDLNGPPFNADMPVQVGQTYALVVMNWTGSTNGYTIDFTQSTASIYDANPPSLISVTPDCANQSLTLDFNEPIVTSSVEPGDFSLLSPSGNLFPFTAVNPDNPSANAQSGFTIVLPDTLLEGGLYTLTINSSFGNVQDLCGNTVVDTVIQVPISAPLSYTADITTACNGAGGAIQVANITGGHPPFQTLLNASNIPGGVAADLPPGEYGLLIVDSVGCIAFEHLVVPDHAIEVVIPVPQDSLSCSNPLVTIAGVEVLPPQTPTYLWTAVTTSGTDPQYSTVINPQVQQPGIYTLLATDQQTGRADQASVTIMATDLSSMDLSGVLLPNVVSPNGDGLNDTWRPYLPSAPDMDITHLFDEYTLTVFDRWGKSVYATGESGPRTWKPYDTSDGTYFYTIALRSECGTPVDKKLNGTITVLR